ncbi:MAG: hypothetical protein OK449_00785 [Thaumarchaeota archaeon]|nr:hypothetical protein [Nitrososphaerota archaeon]
MVFFKDEGSEFDAPLDKVWKLNQSEGSHSHPSLKNSNSSMDGEHTILSYETQMPDGSWVKNKVRMSVFPPIGIIFETLEGPLKGSVSFQYYTPKGAKTGITVVGEWKASGIPDAQLHAVGMKFLEAVYNEDKANLAKM